MVEVVEADSDSSVADDGEDYAVRVASMVEVPEDNTRYSSWADDFVDDDSVGNEIDCSADRSSVDDASGVDSSADNREGEVSEVALAVDDRTEVMGVVAGVAAEVQVDEPDFVSSEAMGLVDCEKEAEEDDGVDVHDEDSMMDASGTVGSCCCCCCCSHWARGHHPDRNYLRDGVCLHVVSMIDVDCDHVVYATITMRTATTMIANENVNEIGILFENESENGTVSENENATLND